MTPAERWRQEGFELGLKLGLERGLRLCGQRALLLELLRTKFGDTLEPWFDRLESGDEAALLLYAKRTLSANSLEEVFADGK